ncbi:MAG: hypothetical protein K8S87_02870 [Planctomycetes bacterium]|nr:hypothetical protein [Planctomycetota bacterium]
MKITISILLALLLASCAEKQIIPVVELVDPKIYEDIQDEVSKGGWWINHSLPELKYVMRNYFPWLKNIKTHDLESTDGQHFQVLVLNSQAKSMPGEDFILAYLKNPDGKIVHWKSQWLYNRRGDLKTKLLDVNDDGIMEFCFICEQTFRVKQTEQLLAAYCVQGQQFEPVIAEQFTYITVEFAKTSLSDGLLLEPKLTGKYAWQTGKLYEIPVRVTNRSAQSKNLRGCNLRFRSSDDFYGTYFYCGFTIDSLAPGATVEALMTVRFGQGFGELKFGLEIEEYEESH